MDNNPNKRAKLSRNLFTSSNTITIPLPQPLSQTIFNLPTFSFFPPLGNYPQISQASNHNEEKDTAMTPTLQVNINQPSHIPSPSMGRHQYTHKSKEEEKETEKKSYPTPHSCPYSFNK